MIFVEIHSQTIIKQLRFASCFDPIPLNFHLAGVGEIHFSAIAMISKNIFLIIQA